MSRDESCLSQKRWETNNNATQFLSANLSTQPTYLRRSTGNVATSDSDDAILRWKNSCTSQRRISDNVSRPVSCSSEHTRRLLSSDLDYRREYGSESLTRLLEKYAPKSSINRRFGQDCGRFYEKANLNDKHFTLSTENNIGNDRKTTGDTERRSRSPNNIQGVPQFADSELFKGHSQKMQTETENQVHKNIFNEKLLEKYSFCDNVGRRKPADFHFRTVGSENTLENHVTNSDSDRADQPVESRHTGSSPTCPRNTHVFPSLAAAVKHTTHVLRFYYRPSEDGSNSDLQRKLVNNSLLNSANHSQECGETKKDFQRQTCQSPVRRAKSLNIPSPSISPNTADKTSQNTRCRLGENSILKGTVGNDAISGADRFKSPTHISSNSHNKSDTALQDKGKHGTDRSCDSSDTSFSEARSTSSRDSTEHVCVQSTCQTQVMPSVVVSYHSNDTDDLVLDNNKLTNDDPVEENLLHIAALEHNNSSTSLNSSHSDSSRSLWSDSSFSMDDDDDQDPQRDRRKRLTQSSWKKIRRMVKWSPFVQHFKKHKYPWIQLAGHEGNFEAGEAGTILKKRCPKEDRCLQTLMTDILRPYVPEYKGDIEKNASRYIQMQDLLCEFEVPSVMDCKIGTRTYLEEELQKARENPKLRKDMYKKMIEVDVDEPTEEERAQEAITKPRYMIWRETISSSSTLGFRIEGIKNPDGHSTNFKTTKTKPQIKKSFSNFTKLDKTVLAKYLRRLKAIRATLELSPFFASHEVIGSSLLFVHDQTGKASVWMIDFGKTSPMPDGETLNHRATWEEGTREDGYLFGLDNLIIIIEELYEEANEALETDTTEDS